MSLFASRLLRILSILAVLTLLHLKLNFPVGRNLHEAILQPDKIFSETPVRGQKQLPWHILLCLWNLSRYLVLVNVPIHLAAYFKVCQPISSDVTDLAIYIGEF